MGKYTKRDILKVNEVTHMQRYYFWSSTDLVNTYFVENQIRNCTLTSDDIQAGGIIYRTQYQLLRGKC